MPRSIMPHTCGARLARPIKKKKKIEKIQNICINNYRRYANIPEILWEQNLPASQFIYTKAKSYFDKTKLPKTACYMKLVMTINHLINIPIEKQNIYF